jgi:Domain of unknown function (DUF4145)
MTRVCPHCNVVAHFTEVWSRSSVDDDLFHVAGIFARFCWVCDNCARPICGVYLSSGSIADPPLVWPEAVMFKTYPDVPEAIAAAASEAHQALGALAPRASVAMARATVEATAKDKGITGRNLEVKIDNLAGASLISETMRVAAHEVRFAGNEAAHGDLVDEPISVEDAEEILRLMDAILHRVYQEPAEIARVRAKREGRRSREASAESVG